MSQPIATIGWSIKTHMAQVILSHMPSVLSTVIDPAYGLTLVPPQKESIYIAPQEESILTQWPCTVVIDQPSPSRVNTILSGSGSQGSLEIVWPLRTRIMYSTLAYTPQTILGRQETQMEHYHRVAEAYQGALIHTLSAYGHHPEIAQNVILRSAIPLLQNLNDRYLSGAIVEWDITTRVLVPTA